ncbi:MAG: helix-turn-helix domain-containing protein [Solirubrobacteraceae bacterium]
MGETVPPLAALVGRIDREQLVETMLGTFRTEIPGYARLPDAVIRGQVREVARQNTDLCLDWVAGAGAPEAARFDDFKTSAKNRATEGMPLEDLLRAYRIGATTAWRVLIAVATPAEHDALTGAAELVMVYIDQVSGTVAAAYLEERQHLVSEQERGLRGLLNALLGGDALAPGHHETAARLGLRLRGRFATFALAIPSGGARAHARAAAGLRAVAALALTEGDRVVGLWLPGRALAPPALPAGAVAVLDPEVAREELAASLADVRLAMDILLQQGRTGVVPLQDLTLDLLLARAPRVAADLRTRVLDPLGPRDGRSRGDLHRTVATYVALHRDRRQTAARLHIHPNTLDHRLRRARELNGLNLDDPEDLATMVLALHEGR